MTKLKKLAALLLSGAMCVSFAFAFTACNGDGTEGGSQTGEQTDNTESGGSDIENGNANTGNGGGNADADTGNNDGGSSDGESGNESDEKTDNESDNTEGGDAAENDGDEGGDNTENNDDESDNVETDDTYYGKTYTVDFETLDYYVDGSISEEAKAEYTANIMSGSTITITLQEDGTGVCICTAYDGSMELDISFDYTAVECTQISYTSTSSLNDTYFYNKTFTRDFSGVQFEFSDYVITKYIKKNNDYTNQLSPAEMAEIGSGYMNIFAYGYDGSDMVIFFAEEGFGEWAQYYYEEATGNYYYYEGGTDDFYCKVTGEYISDKDISTGYKFDAEYQYNESEIITAYGALKAAE